jgi:hypothetical protein
MGPLDQKLAFREQPQTLPQTQNNSQSTTKKPQEKNASWLSTTRTALLGAGAMGALATLYFSSGKPAAPGYSLNPFGSLGSIAGTLILGGVTIFLCKQSQCCANLRKGKNIDAFPLGTNLFADQIRNPNKKGPTKGGNGGDDSSSNTVVESDTDDNFDGPRNNNQNQITPTYSTTFQPRTLQMDPRSSSSMTPDDFTRSHGANSLNSQRTPTYSTTFQPQHVSSLSSQSRQSISSPSFLTTSRFDDSRSSYNSPTSPMRQLSDDSRRLSSQDFFPHNYNESTDDSERKNTFDFEVLSVHEMEDIESRATDDRNRFSDDYRKVINHFKSLVAPIGSYDKELIRGYTAYIEEKIKKNEESNEVYEFLREVLPAIIRVDKEAALELATKCILSQNEENPLDLADILTFINSYSRDMYGRPTINFLIESFLKSDIKIDLIKQLIENSSEATTGERLKVSKYNSVNLPLDCILKFENELLIPFLEKCAELDRKSYTGFQNSIANQFLELMDKAENSCNTHSANVAKEATKTLKQIFDLVLQKNLGMFFNLLGKVSSYREQNFVNSIFAYIHKAIIKNPSLILKLRQCSEKNDPLITRILNTSVELEEKPTDTIDREQHFEGEFMSLSKSDVPLFEKTNKEYYGETEGLLDRCLIQ